MSGPLADRPFATILPPPLESMGVSYLTPLMYPTPVATRRPEPDRREDTIGGFLRVESGGGTQVGEQLLWDMNLILHGYHPDEVQAEKITQRAVAWGANAAGITTDVDGEEWYVTFSRASALATKVQDPLVNLTRYRAMVMWRIPGNALVV